MNQPADGQSPPLIEPLLSDDALLRDIQQAGLDPDRLHLWWLGQSGFLLEHQGRRILLDPYLSDSLTEKYATTDKPHIRLSRRVIDPARLTGIELVTSSHNHTDHLDGATLKPLRKANPSMKLLVPAANRTFAAARLGMDESELLTLDGGQSLRMDGLEIHAVPAAHEKLDVDAQGRLLYLGYILRIGRWTIYHSGDTMLYDGMAEFLAPYEINIAILPINGRGPERHVSGNLWGDEAARLASQIGARLAVPCHYDMFAFNTATPELFENTCRKLRQPFRTLKLGERLSYA